MFLWCESNDDNMKKPVKLGCMASTYNAEKVIPHASWTDPSQTKVNKPGIGIDEYFTKVDFNGYFLVMNINGSFPTWDFTCSFIEMDVNVNNMAKIPADPESGALNSFGLVYMAVGQPQ